MNRKKKVVTRRMGNLGLTEFRIEVATPLWAGQQDENHILEPKNSSWITKVCTTPCKCEN
jgi:hypothetical protein